MGIRNGDRVGCFWWNGKFGAQIVEATVIDADPNATMVSVQVEDEPFFRRIPAWMLQVIA